MIKQTVCPNCGGLLQSESHGWICKKCKGFISLADGKFYEYVEKPFVPPMTNADRIRAMSDEELSVFLWEFEKEEIARANEYALERRKITEWLKQPAQNP